MATHLASRTDESMSQYRQTHEYHEIWARRMPVFDWMLPSSNAHLSDACRSNSRPIASWTQPLLVAFSVSDTSATPV